MKKLIITLSFLFVVLALDTTIKAQTPDGAKFEFKAKNNQMMLDTLYIDNLPDPVNLKIEFENKGTAPLVVMKVSGCCGTNVTDWTQRPLKPGEKGIIHVSFRVPPRPHKIGRNITVISNDKEGKKKLNIIGVVTESDDGSLNLGNPYNYQ